MNIIKPRKKVDLIYVALIIAVVIAIGIFAAPVAHAQNEIVDGLLEFFGWVFLTLAGWFIQGTIFVLKFVIEIASYNDYIRSSPVNLGWVLVRDVTNMFFVIILMVIAFGTVLGLEQYAWQKLLVKFVFAAIFVNFSRVICGVIIDAAQVFMMTFISAVAATAGGNLVALFKLDNVLSYSQNAAGEDMGKWNMLTQAIASCIFAFTAMAVTASYLFVLLGRWVSLLVLIILSPLAFVLSVLPQGQAYSKQWWSQFTNNVIVGPVLAFFLWLSFAVAGGANVHNEFASAPYSMTSEKLEASGISQTANENVVGGLGEIMKWDNMASFIIAIALMLAGVKVAQQLGTAGAGAMGAAAGAAGKFAMAAGGIAAARWAVGKAAEGGKKVAAAPFKLVGGAIEKRAESLKYAAKAKVAGGKEWWNRQVVERGVNLLAASKFGKKVGIEAGAGGAGLVGFAARRLQFGSAAAKLKTRKEMAEGAEKLYTTSIVEPSKLKLEAAKIEARLEKGAYIKEGVVKGRMAKARAAVEEGDMSPQYEEIKDEKGKVVALRRKSFVEFANAQKAKADRLEVQHKRHEEEEIADARDNERARDGKSRVHVDVVRARHKDEDQKFYSGLSREKTLANIENQRKRLSLETDPAKRAAIQEDLNDQVCVALERGASFGPAALMKAIDSRRIEGREFSANNPQDMQALVLMALNEGLTVQSNNADIQRAAAKCAELYGEKWDAFSAQFAAGLKASSLGGAIENAGLMKITDDGSHYRFVDASGRVEVDEETGREKRIYDNKEDGDHIQSEQKYAISKARGKPDDVSMAVDRRIEGGQDKQYIGSGAAVQNLAMMLPTSDLGAKNSNQWFLSKLETILVNTLQDPRNSHRAESFFNFYRQQCDSDKPLLSLLRRMNDDTKRLINSSNIQIHVDNKTLNVEND